MARSRWDCATEKEHEAVIEEIADWVILKLREAPDGDERWASDLLEDAAERADEIVEKSGDRD